MSSIIDWEQDIRASYAYSSVEVDFRLINNGQHQIDFWKVHFLMMAGTTSMTDEWHGFLIEAGDTLETTASFFFDGFTKQIETVTVAKVELFNF